MSAPKIGDMAPDFELPSHEGGTVSLSQFRGKNVVLYFYPKDNTSGCTLEAEGFRDREKEFEELDTVILGVSKDSIKSHSSFALKTSINFDLLSDPDQRIHRLYDVIKPKKMYGREYMGVERRTFVIDKTGKILKEYRGVKVKGHVDEVLGFLKTL